MRRVPRVSVDLPFILLGSGISCKGNIVNLSLSGAFLVLQNPPSNLKSMVNLKFRFSNKATELEVLARIIRNTPQGVGVEFLDLDNHSRAFLWDNIVHLLPRNLNTCPYCGKDLEYGHNNIKNIKCPHCRNSLAFTHKEYLAKLMADDQDEEMVGTCHAMRNVFHLIRKVAPSDVSVLITGDSGTGKEMVARAIHERSQRVNAQFVPINCGAIPSMLLESELFGYEKGAFTGAFRTTIGTVERAKGGTLFLDEIGELPLELQVKLLRFLEEFSFTRVGGRQPIHIDLRVISATNSDLEKMIQAGRFREDLYYRLNVIKIQLPSLKDRGDDSLIMANVFLKRYAKKVGKDIQGFSEQAVRAILTHQWTGNVRELINCIRRGVVLADGPWLTPENLGLSADRIKPVCVLNGRGLKEARNEFEAKLVAEVLDSFQGNSESASKALKITRSMLYHLVKKHRLERCLLNHGKTDARKKEPLVV